MCGIPRISRDVWLDGTVVGLGGDRAWHKHRGSM